MTTKRQRPNSWENKYNQWVLAGKLAEANGAMQAELASAKTNPQSVYRTNEGAIHYSMIGQEYLRQIGVSITEF